MSDDGQEGGIVGRREEWLTLQVRPSAPPDVAVASQPPNPLLPTSNKDPFTSPDVEVTGHPPKPLLANPTPPLMQEWQATLLNPLLASPSRHLRWKWLATLANPLLHSPTETPSPHLI